MAYTKQTWANDEAGGTPISAARLNYMEEGIENPVDSIPPGTYAEGFTTSAVADDATNAHTQFLADIAAAQTADTILRLRGGTYLDATGRLEITTGNVRIKGEPGTIIHKDHNSNAIRLTSPIEVGGDLSAASAGTTTVTVAGVTWTVNEHVGKWAHMAAAFPMARKVMSNTADTLTLDYPLGNSVAAGTDLTFRGTGFEVDIEHLAIEGRGVTDQANIVIEYASKVRLHHVRSDECSGNALSIYWSENLDIVDYESTNGQFGMFIYGCRNGKIVRPRIKGWSSVYGGQIKDCIGVDFVDPWADGEGVGEVGYNIKSSGLNPATDCHIINGQAVDTASFGLYAHGLQNEGTHYIAENFSIRGGSTRGCNNGFGVLESPADLFRNVRVDNVQVLDSTVAGFLIQARNAVVRGIHVEGSAGRGGLINSNGVVFEGTFKNNNRSAGNDAELRVDGASDCIIDVDVIHSLTTSDSVYAVQELNTCNRNQITRRIRDTATDYYSADVLLVGTESRAFRTAGFDTVNSATTIRAFERYQQNDIDWPTTGGANLDRRRIDSISISMASGILRGGYFVAQSSEAITKVAVLVGATAAGATPTLVRVGIWAAGIGGSLTSLVASTTNNTALLGTINTENEIPLTATWNMVRGVRYYAGLLVVTGAAAPVVAGASPINIGGINTILGRSPAIGGVLTGQTDLPATASPGGTALIPYIELRK